MKKRRNKLQKTRILLYIVLLLILGILALIDKLSIPALIICYIVIEVVFNRYKLWRKSRYLKATLDVVDRMEGEEFEEFLEIHFKEDNYKVSLTPKTCDYGADLILKKSGIKTVVQAKRWKQKVGIEAVQQAVASINYYKADTSMVVTNSYFTQNAENLAKANNVTLINRRDLSFFINHKKENREKCPVCNSDLVEKEGRYGLFIGCTNYPKCKYTHKI